MLILSIYVNCTGFRSDPTNLTCYENVTFCDHVDDNGIEWVVEINETGTMECPIGFVGTINSLLHNFE